MKIEIFASYKYYNKKYNLIGRIQYFYINKNILLLTKLKCK